MKGMGSSCRAIIVGAAIALLAGCGGPQPAIGISEARPAGSVRPLSSGFHVLFDFSEHSVYGVNPMGLIAANDTLYGTTSTDGDGYGTIFSLTTDGTAKVLHSFLGGSDGEFPAAPPIAVDGTLYGTTSGGLQGGGTVFSIRTDGSHYRVLHSFTGGSDGMNPMAGLIAAHGVLYGTTYSGGDTGVAASTVEQSHQYRIQPVNAQRQQIITAPRGAVSSPAMIGYWTYTAGGVTVSVAPKTLGRRSVHRTSGQRQ